MAWTTPRDWAVGDLGDAGDAALLNEQIRDNLDYLYTAVGTMHLWVPATTYYTSAAWAALTASGDHPGSPLGTSGAYANMSARCPVAYASLLTAKVIVIPQATQAAANWDLDVQYGAVGEAYNTHTASDTATTYNVTSGQLFAVDILALLTSIAAGDYLGVKFALSNSAHDVHVLGLQLTW